jgi:hypothetical protein
MCATDWRRVSKDAEATWNRTIAVFDMSLALDWESWFFGWRCVSCSASHAIYRCADEKAPRRRRTGWILERDSKLSETSINNGIACMVLLVGIKELISVWPLC